MENFRDFEAGPDPFGRAWQVRFKYLQTGISIRHSDSVDVCFILESGDERMRKIVVIPLADVRAWAERSGRKVSDGWCSRLAMCRIKEVVSTAEDFEKDYLTVTPAEIARYDEAIKKWEEEWVKQHAA
jgi:hypothetical protein